MTEKRKFLTVIVGPTCSGKTTLQKALFLRGFVKVITTTTREPRPGECQGVDYNFVTREEFKTLITNGDLYEHEEFQGNYYGVSKLAVEQAFEKSPFCTVIVEPKGLDSILFAAPLDINVKIIMIHASLPTLIKRLRQRGASDDEIAKREAGLRDEMSQMSYTPGYGKRVISPTTMKQVETFADHYDPRNGHVEDPIQVGHLARP